MSEVFGYCTNVHAGADLAQTRANLERYALAVRQRFNPKGKLSIGLWLSAVNVRFRDVHLAVPFLIMVGLFVSPITYPFRLVPAHLHAVYAINPLVGVLETYRWMLFPTAPWPGTLVLIPIAISILLVVTGALYFQRTEHTFADVI